MNSTKSRGCSENAVFTAYRLLNMSWRKVAALFAGIVLMLFLSISVFTELRVHSKIWYRHAAPCKISDSLMSDMKVLVFKIHESLDRLTIPHTICYGTLWGTLRNGHILPWDNNVDYCVNAVDIAKIDRQRLESEFNKNGMTMSYSSRSGSYEVHYESAVGFITTFLEYFNGDMYRTGWIHNVRWWFNSDPKAVHFPAQLLEAPFPVAKLEGRDVPIPHENIEILKYLYPDDWWLEVKPPGC